ncbi:hypothetical protein [Methylophaga thiooxydans]|nr:hypothetical protein [Methylophaga thiooxydans]
MTATETEQVEVEPYVAIQDDETATPEAEEVAAVRSELEDLRAKVRARTEQLKANVQSQSSAITSDDEQIAPSEFSQLHEQHDVTESKDNDVSMTIAENQPEINEADAGSSVESSDLEDEEALLAQWQQQLAEDEKPLASEDTADATTKPAEDPAPVDANSVHEEIDTGPPVELTNAESAVSEMWQDLTEEPLPSEDDLQAMFEEIKQLDQPQSNQTDEVNDKGHAEQGQLKSILSSIPSFSQMNKKPNEPE